MKKRNGFVSNSSSSSFIIDLNKLPEHFSADDIKHLMFGDDEYVIYEYGTGLLNTVTLANIVYTDLKSEIATKEDVFNELSDTCYDYDLYDRINEKHLQGMEWPIADASEETRKEYRKRQLAARIELDAIVTKKVEEKYKELMNNEPSFVIIEYGDDSGQYYTHLEQSGVLEDTFSAIKVSKH